MMSRLFAIIASVGLLLGTATSGWAEVETASDPTFSPASARRLAVLVLDQKIQAPSELRVTAHSGRGGSVVLADKSPSRHGSPASGKLENDQSNFQRFVEDEFVTVLMKKHYSMVARSDLQTVLNERHLQLSLIHI